MNCESVEPLFSDYIDGILDPSSTFGLQAHLRFCPECRATLAGMSQVRMALHSLGGTSPPARFKLQLSNRLQEELHRRRCPPPTDSWGAAGPSNFPAWRTRVRAHTCVLYLFRAQTLQM